MAQEKPDLEAVLKTHFDQTTMVINRQKNDAKDALGILLTDDQIGGLCGAPTKSTITVTVKHEADEDVSKKNDMKKTEVVPGGLLLTVTNSDYINSKNEVIIYPVDEGQDDNGDDRVSLGVYIKLVDFLPANGKAFAGIGAYMIAAIARATRSRQDILRMRLQAAGGRSWNDRNEQGQRWYGYASWPKYGFDMDLHEITTSMFPSFNYDPKGLKSCKKISDVLALGKGGAEFWKVVGDGWDMEFDLSADSPSFRILNAFLKTEV